MTRPVDFPKKYKASVPVIDAARVKIGARASVVDLVPVDRMQRAIWTLFNAGFDTCDIAAVTNRGEGEIVKWLRRHGERVEAIS